MNDKAKDDREATKAVRRSLETAETGHSESAERLNQAEKANPVATESVEQAVSEVRRVAGCHGNAGFSLRQRLRAGPGRWSMPLGRSLLVWSDKRMICGRSSRRHQCSGIRSRPEC